MPLDFSVQILKDECPIESDCQWEFLYHSTHSTFHLPIYRCVKCGLQSQFPRPKPEELYTEDYYTGKSEFHYKDERETYKFDRYVWDARIRNIKKFRTAGNFLDIGCSFGGLLDSAKATGFDAYGVEISQYAAETCRHKGIQVWNSSFLEAELPDNYFDVVTMIEVIEHLENPREVFHKLGRILKPGGLLLIQTANFEGWQAKIAGASYHYYLPGHFYYYSDSNLKQALRKNGFQTFQTYYGVDFSLVSKLRKSRGSFNSLWDYRKWFRISIYHLLSKLTKDGQPRTSSYVLYARKDLKNEKS